MTRATINRPRIVMILIPEKMNSASPYIRIAKIFKQTTKAMSKVIQRAILIWSAPCQYWMTTVAAEISVQRVIADKYQF